MAKFKNEIGNQHGKLKVIKRAENKGSRSAWICKCDCGNITKPISGTALRNKSIKSCGCLLKEKTKETRKKMSETRKKFIGEKNPMYGKRGKNSPLFGRKRPGHSKKMLGRNNPAWKGGITKGRSKIWKSEKYQKWRNAVFQRDNYTCQQCFDSSGGNLECHHIFPFSEYKSIRFLVSNGMTLCKDCHEKTFRKELEFRLEIVRLGFKNLIKKQIWRDKYDSTFG